MFEQWLGRRQCIYVIFFYLLSPNALFFFECIWPVNGQYGPGQFGLGQLGPGLFGPGQLGPGLFANFFRADNSAPNIVYE